MIIVKNHKCSIEKLKSDYPNAVIIDVTSHAKDEFLRLSPFYPLGGIPVPYSPGWTASCMEAIWQGLKDYDSVGTDYSLFKNTTMKNLKRTTRRFGHLRGHRKGVGSKDLLGYIDARKYIYLPTYKWILENKVQNEIETIKTLAQTHDVILLDYATNADVEDCTKPLSHAALIKAFIEGKYPKYPAEEGACSSLVTPDTSTSFAEGQVIHHPTFGEGTITSIEGNKAHVLFIQGGEKLISLSFLARIGLTH